ncbi:hypothetical protein BDN70DRAFT_302031 [Pholiota conissans]|uniref:Uncharacterized protein n=1 Tax=Pholiota conissans TaxID=109636 RepID=A0A9P5Z9A8_9AGAR|nr:hypothetical protein BDN70DRAFT_302031 [Pholiota conissans]
MTDPPLTYSCCYRVLFLAALFGRIPTTPTIFVPYFLARQGMEARRMVGGVDRCKTV